LELAGMVRCFGLCGYVGDVCNYFEMEIKEMTWKEYQELKHPKTESKPVIKRKLPSRG
jgi:hypothetical protein